MKYPSMLEVESADRELICRWYRFLASPRDDDQKAIMNRIVDRFRSLGGFSPEISKRIGWRP